MANVSKNGIQNSIPVKNISTPTKKNPLNCVPVILNYCVSSKKEESPLRRRNVGGLLSSNLVTHVEEGVQYTSSQPCLNCFSSPSIINSKAFLTTDALTNRGVFLPSCQMQEVGKRPAVIGFDWVEWTGKKTEQFLCRTLETLCLEETNHPDIKKIIDTSIENGIQIATLKINLGAGIDKSWCMVKLENKMCYQGAQNMLALIKKINYELGIVFKNFTRIDVACDVQHTDYRNMTMQQIMDKVGKGEYIFKGKKVKAIDGKTDYAVMEIETTRRGRNIETVRVGSRKSGVSITMYNKTKEMKVKVDKPWVREGWKEAGFYDDMDTFRIEFSFMKNPKSLINTATGEVYSHEDINMIADVENLYKALYTEHFKVAIYEPGIRFSRLKPVAVLSLDKVYTVKERLTEKHKSTNYIKASLKYLMHYAANEQLDGANIHTSEVYRLIRNISCKHDLQHWFRCQFPHIDIDEMPLSYGDYLTSKEIHSNRLVQASMFN